MKLIGSVGSLSLNNKELKALNVSPGNCPIKS